MSPHLSSPSVCSRASTTGIKFNVHLLHFGTFYSYINISSSSCNFNNCKSGLKNRLSTVLEVVDRHGPCAQTDLKQTFTVPSLAQILVNDQLRVKSIQARAVKPDPTHTNKKLHKSQNRNKSRDKNAKLPTHSGEPLDTSNYFVTIGLGTPKRRLSLVFDTGSDITWTQCLPCAHCYKQNDSIFNPSASSTYSKISCKSKQCNYTFGTSCYRDDTCFYDIYYNDGSESFGFLSRDKLTITPTDVFPDFLFGCSRTSTGMFGKVDGLLGLSKSPISFVYQTAKMYGLHFSYCLPSDISSTGFLAFGKNRKTSNKDDTVIFTPLVAGISPDILPIYYFIEIIAISIGGTRLPISGSVFKTAPTIIDSGTVVTRLPPAAYNATSKEFKKQMNALNYKSAPADYYLDTCFHISGHTNITKVPTMSFTFKGNAKVDLDPSGIIKVVSSKVMCLAFAGNSHPDDVAIFGNFQQRKLEVMYDVAGEKLGFRHNSFCQ
ncbi:protein aspartic protease in guard cell 2 [Phtheirospermum japonicum]|uniref:Protein aspartic protease in guard cell 2 n=1 Tax=Phtheirospermum japonicum TaxID=374723 RepID=A0A830B944_9LAMI|nr:protein aspartic protease in guard cell 2 [Phtheirospermum japonicum]